MPEIAPPTVTLRIPGGWSDPAELVERLPDGCRLTPESLTLPDGSEFEFVPMPPDDEFPAIFESSCRRAPTAEERDLVRRYSVNIGLTGPGGSMAAALGIMRAAAAIVRAGGAGVFIDNSLLAHGGDDWIAMTEDGSTDALTFAFAAITRSKRTVYTTGLHVLGFPDLLMNDANVDDEGDTIIEIIRYVCGGEKPVGVGHVLADEQGPRFQIAALDGDEFPPGSPVHNPLGRYRIVNVKDIAAQN